MIFRRRDLITLLGGTVATWPLTARAQPAMPVIGLLIGGSPVADAFRVAAFRQGLSETGYLEGQNVAFEFRWAENRYSRLPALITDLVDHRVTVIVAVGNSAARAAKASNTTIPVVFEMGDDPVSIGLVNNLARPGANITGVTFLGASLVPKLFELLQDAVPKAAVIGLIENPTNPNTEAVGREVQAAAKALGKTLVVAKTVAESDFEAAFVSLVKQQAAAVLVRSDVLFNGRPKQLVALAARHSLPAIYPLREFAVAGGLMSYGASLSDAMRQVGVYTGRVLKGEKPAELPVQQATKVELVINLTTAKTLGLTFPLSLLGRADEVIE